MIGVVMVRIKKKRLRLRDKVKKEIHEEILRKIFIRSKIPVCTTEYAPGTPT